MTTVTLVNDDHVYRAVTVPSTGLQAAKDAKKSLVTDTADPTWRVLKYPDRIVNVALLILGGWLALASVFVFGCAWGSRTTRDLHAALDRQAAIIHALQTLVGRLSKERDRTFDYARKVEGRLDGDLDDELRRLLDGGGGS